MFRKTLTTLAFCLALSAPVLAATPVNINQADAQTIAASLDGVGISKAKAIVAYRHAHGPFKRIDDLANVKGIGSKTLTRNRDAIRLTGGKVAAKAGAAATKPDHGKSPQRL